MPACTARQRFLRRSFSCSRIPRHNSGQLIVERMARREDVLNLDLKTLPCQPAFRFRIPPEGDTDLDIVAMILPTSCSSKPATKR